MISMKSLALGLTVLVGALGGFYGGYHSGRDAGAKSVAVGTSSSPGGVATGTGASGSGGGAAGGAGATGGGAGGFGGGRGNIGTVTGLTSTGFVLHTATGTDVKVVLGNGVTIRKTSDGTIADLQSNSNVTVTGQRNADGELAATSITIIPAGALQPSG